MAGGPDDGDLTPFTPEAGLETPEAGTVRIDDAAVDGAARPDGRAVARLRAPSGMVFQVHNPFPHLSVLADVTSGRVLAKRCPPAEARAEALALLGDAARGAHPALPHAPARPPVRLPRV